jgi:hypothetical protein
MTPADDPTRLLAELRARVEAATAEIEQLAADLVATRALADDLESVVDVLLGLGGATVLVIDDDRRIRGLSRAAAERLEGVAVGKPLSSAVPDDLFDELASRLDAEPQGARPPARAGAGAQVYPLPGGGAVLVLEP